MGTKRDGLARVRKAAGYTQEALAYALGVDPGTVQRWEQGKSTPYPYKRPKLAKLLQISRDRLDELLEGPMPDRPNQTKPNQQTTQSSAAPDSPRTAAFPVLLTEEHERVPAAVEYRSEPTASLDGLAEGDETLADRLASEILGSSTSSETIDRLAVATVSLAESHARMPPQHLVRQVFRLHEQTHVVLRGTQRLRHMRDLYRIESDLLAHACLLFDDLGKKQVALKYGDLALSFAEEAGASQATARTALAKALRWADRLIESAEMARNGYEYSPPSPVRVQLASQEANAAALMGNLGRAQEALQRAEQAAAVAPSVLPGSAWSFPAARQAVFALSIALQARDPDAALRAVETADHSWRSTATPPLANWAQIRAGASVALLMKGSLDEAIDEVEPVFAMSPELRISTVTAWVKKLEKELDGPRFHRDKHAADLRNRIHEFTSSALLAS